jgi:prolyl oligopeptidase
MIGPILNSTRVLLGPASVIACMAGPLACSETRPPIVPPPETARIPVAETLHGVELIDPYRWLEDKDAPETRAWIDAQNGYTDALLRQVKGRQNTRDRLEALMKIAVIRAPTERGGRYFFMKRDADQDLMVIYMREGLDGEDQMLIDPHTMSDDKTTSIGIQDVSHDGNLLVYHIRKGGEDEVEIRLLNLGTRKDLPDCLPKARYFGIGLMPDAKSFYYTRHDEEGPRVYHHTLGTKNATDRYVFGEGLGQEMIAFATPSEDGRYLHIGVYYGSAGKTEIHLKDLKDDGPIRPIATGVDARFFGEIAGDTLFMETDFQAPKGKIVAVNLNKPQRENWKEVVPESDAVIQGFSLAGGKVFVNYLEDVVSRIKIFSPQGEPQGEIAFPSLGSVGSLTGRWDSNEAFFTYSSFHIPTTIYRYSVAEASKTEWARLNVPLDGESLTVKQVWYASKDGTRIPMFILHRKDLQLNGRNPTLLTGYGGFNISLTPQFSSRAIAWAERGGVFAQPNLRGGSEFGENWHKAGMLDNKQNVFDDFIAAAEWLIAEGYTRSDKLAISGGSNGGLLVGAAFTQRPELFRAVVCSVPLLDMVRYHQFLVAKFWVPEYGSSEDPDQFKYILRYSPYHNVKPGTAYPAIMFVTGDADTRVAPLHARKMAAKMQAATGSDRPVLLHYDTKAGHSGGKPVNKAIDDLADELTFLHWQLGMK